MKSLPFVLLLTVLAGFCFVALTRAADVTSIPNNPDLVTQMPDTLPKAVFAGGCFWCLESEFRNKPGVVFTRSGYTGGSVDAPDYQAVTTGRTGHAEAIEVYFDPAKTDYRTLVDHFLRNAHDPTTLNKQWVDEGTQYRSAIFYTDPDQQKIATETIAKIDSEKIYKAKIVTQIVPATTFWPAEEYHQQYYEKYEKENGNAHIRVIMKNELKKKKKSVGD